MNYLSEQHRSRREEYTVNQRPEEVEKGLEEFFTALGEKEGLELLQAGTGGESADHSFRAAGSSAQVSYSLEDGDETAVEVEFYGAAPLVDRLYNHFDGGRPAEIE